jgi:predicted permease
MSWHRRLLNLVRSERLSRDLDREMAFHMAERADELRATGMSEADAMREARRRFGNYGHQKERTRDADVLTWLESVAADLRYAGRALRASPGFALVAILSLGLGIGANTAIFSVADAVLLRSLPVSHPEELVALTLGANPRHYFTNPLWEAIRDRQDAFAGVFASSARSFNLASGGEARRVDGAWVSGDFFTTLGVRPAAGRLLVRADDYRGCPAVAVVSHGFWQREYGGSPNAIGSTISLDGHPFEVVGVADPRFSGVDLGRSMQVYAPLCAEAAVLAERSGLDQRSYWFLRVTGRLKEGETPAEARARLASIAPGVFAATLPPDWGAEGQRDYLRNPLGFDPAPKGFSEMREEYRAPLRALMIVVGLVLLIACANVANLLLARAAVRQREVAVRLAVGAGRGRLVRQLLTESLLLSLLGAVVGLALARWGGGLLVTMLSSATNTVWLDLQLDGRVLAFTIAVATASAILFGVAPAWRSARVDPQTAMKASGPGSVGGGRSRMLVVKSLVVGQVALALALVMTAGLLLGSFRRLVTLDPGFRRDGLLLVSADLQNARYPDERLHQVKRELLDRLRATPGVRSASASIITPVSGRAWNTFVVADGGARGPNGEGMAWFNEVSDGYFQTLGTALVAGRDFDRRDGPGSPRVAVVNETMARRFFGGANAIGKTFRSSFGDRPGPLVEVVGVVRDAKYNSLREEPEPIAYVPLGQNERQMPGVIIELRADGAPTTLVPAIKTAVAGMNPAIALDFTTLSDQVAASLRTERMLASLSGFFGVLALLLAIIGLYGTLSYSVARRRGEIGIRIALGAARARVLRMVLGEAGRMVAAGLLLGAAASLATTRLVASFLFGVTPSDPATLTLSALTLALVGAAAGALPAWRAARVDPMIALREE